MGTVRYADRDLYKDYEELRHRIAIVPQDDVLHTALTVRKALSYAARLRFPADTTTARPGESGWTRCSVNSAWPPSRNS